MIEVSPYALSTAWNWRRHKNAKELDDEINSLGFDTVELNFTLTKWIVEEFIKLKNDDYIKISSTHNFCPLPENMDPKQASPDYYSLSSLDAGEREKAVKFTKNSLDFAAKLGARALILHLGRVGMEDVTKKLFTITDKNKFEKEKMTAMAQREKIKGPFLDMAMESLDELLKYAASSGVAIAIENRYYIREMPSLEEFKIIFDRFKDKNLFYWHDAGHAELHENLGILRHEDYLTAFSNRLLGMHLHDIILFSDHLAPGCGEFDFARLKPFMKPDIIKVIEAHKVASPLEIKRSVEHLKRAFGK